MLYLASNASRFYHMLSAPCCTSLFMWWTMHKHLVRRITEKGRLDGTCESFGLTNYSRLLRALPTPAMNRPKLLLLWASVPVCGNSQGDFFSPLFLVIISTIADCSSLLAFFCTPLSAYVFSLHPTTGYVNTTMIFFFFFLSILQTLVPFYSCFWSFAQRCMGLLQQPYSTGTFLK